MEVSIPTERAVASGFMPPRFEPRAFLAYETREVLKDASLTLRMLTCDRAVLPQGIVVEPAISAWIGLEAVPPVDQQDVWYASILAGSVHSDDRLAGFWSIGNRGATVGRLVDEASFLDAQAHRHIGVDAEWTMEAYLEFPNLFDPTMPPEAFRVFEPLGDKFVNRTLSFQGTFTAGTGTGKVAGLGMGETVPDGTLRPAVAAGWAMQRIEVR